MEVSILSMCFCLFMMSIILGIIIVYIIDKKLSNVIVKIPRLEPIVIKTEKKDGKVEVQLREKDEKEEIVDKNVYKERLIPANKVENNFYHNI